MHRLWHLPLVTLFSASVLLSQEPPVPTPHTVAEKVWTAFQRATWDAPIREWVGPESIGTGLECKEFSGDSYDHAIDDDWCYRCVEQGKTEMAQWSFYILTLEKPLVCRLERFDVSVTGCPVPVLDQIHNNLQERLVARYGAGKDPPRRFGGLGEANSAYWQKVQFWQTTDVQIYLYIVQSKYHPPSVGLLARHRHLADVIAAERKRPYWFKWGRWLERWGTPLDRRLAETLRPAFPKLPSLLLTEPAFPSKPAAQEELRTTLRRLLQRANTAAPETRPALLLAAERLANRAHEGEISPSGQGWIRDWLAGYELDYHWNHLGNNWAYKHNLLWRVWRNYATTEWGEGAFLMLLNSGWDTSTACEKGTDLFREVIRRGEQFLAQRPDSPYRLDVLFALAQAYETCWSLSRASVQDSYVDRARYLEGAWKAREKAISYYEKVLKLAPAKYEGAYARQRLPRLKLGIDTNQRRFFCIYD